MAGILANDQKHFAFRLRTRGWRLVDIAREVGDTARWLVSWAATAASPRVFPTSGKRELAVSP